MERRLLKRMVGVLMYTTVDADADRDEAEQGSNVLLDGLTTHLAYAG